MAGALKTRAPARGARDANAGMRSDLPVLVLLVLSGWTSMAPLPLVTGSNTGRVVALLVCAALWLAAHSLGMLPRLDHRARYLAVALAVVVGVIVTVSALSPYAGRALTWGSIGFFGAPVWVALVVIVWGTLRVSLGRERRLWLAASLGWVAVSLVWALADMGASRPVAGGFNTGNHFAAMMLLATPLLLWLADTAGSRVEAVAWYVAAAFAAVGVVASRSAAGVLGLAVAVALAAAIIPRLLGGRDSRSVRWVRIVVWGVVGVSVFVLALALAAPTMVPTPVRTFVQQDVFGPTVDTRVEMWKAALRVIREHPLLGVGADGFHLAAQPFFSERLFSLEPVTGILSAPPDPHSWPFLVAVSFGIVGLLVVAGLGVVWLRQVVGSREGELPDRRDLRLAAGVGTVGFLAAMFFVPWAAILGGFPAMCVGLAAACPGREEPPAGVAARARGGLARAATAMVAMAFLVVAVMFVAGLIHLDRAVNSTTAEAAVSEFDAAAEWLPTYPYPRFMSLHAQGQQLGASPDQLAAWQARVIADTGLREDATYTLLLVRDSLDQAFRWSRNDVNWEAALLAEARGRFPAALDGQLEQAHLALLQGDAAAARGAIDGLDESIATLSRVSLYRYYAAVADGDNAEAARLRPLLEPEYGPLQLLAPQ